MSEETAMLDLVVKSSNNLKVQVSISAESTVEQFKEALESKIEVPADQQRLIYSGRILRDPQTLQSYNIKSGHTIHLVKNAKSRNATQESLQGQAVGSTSGGASGNDSSAASDAIPTIPRMAAGQVTGNPLSDLTGARYAGFANLPSASMFGPDGGMGPGLNFEEALSMLENPEVAERMQAVLDNPELFSIGMDPMMGQLDPEQSRRIYEIMRSPEFRQLMANPANLRAMLQQARQLQSVIDNLGSLSQGTRGGMGGAARRADFPLPGGRSQDAQLTSTEAAATGGSGSSAAPEHTPREESAHALNAYANLVAGLRSLGGLGDLASLGGLGALPQETDNRPPEERYESQLRQLNELGFYDFDRNVRALRRSGGNVQGAIEALLDNLV